MGFKKIIKDAYFTLVKRKEILPVYFPINDNNLLDGKVSLIIGGDGDIGIAISKQLIKSGSKVIIAGSNKTNLDIAKKALGDVKTIILNLNDIQSFRNKIAEASGFYGGVDIFINAAGVHINRKDLNLLNISLDEWDKVMNINLKGTYFLAQEMAKYFIKRKLVGHILIITSSLALEPGWSPYRISKSALESMIKGLAQQLLPYGIVVNGIGPGPTATKLLNYKKGDSISTQETTNERYTLPEEIAAFAKLLVSDLGDSAVGQTIYLSGGRGIIDIR